MTGSRLIRKIIVFSVFFLALLPGRSNAEGFTPDTLMTGTHGSPVTVHVFSPEYHRLDRFGEERTESLNRLLKHFGLSVTLDGSVSETELLIDQNPVFSYFETCENNIQKTVYSFDPDTVYERTGEEAQEGENEFIRFLDDHFFFLNRMLDDLYPVFEKTAAAFEGYGKYSAASLTFRGYGKGVGKLTIQLPEQFVSESFPGVLAGLAETAECRELIEKLVFSGPQKIILLYDQEGRVLRINYDGKAGFSPESMRKVSLVWRCLRTADQKKDNLTLKTPALEGYDKYNVIYERQIDLSDSSNHSVTWNLQIDMKADEKKRKITFTADLSASGSVLNGKAQYSEKQDGREEKIIIVPSLQKENESEYTGTIEIEHISGKILTSSYQASIRAVSGHENNAPDISGLHTVRVQETGESFLQDKMNSLLIRKLLTLPAEDVEFFSMDIPEDDWNSLVQSLF